ncbi:S8 family serine peptidase [Tissierella sp.]|uniref:S8 family serine peptidase n=1 Tax=Tissierella sp. TaxID=41274 RepID=UPI0028A9EDCD|nr:S8 family serine peptidase [Tissierella sp.]
MNSHLLKGNKEKFDKLNIISWQNKGITGKGVKIGIIGYSPKSHHNGAELIKQVAPDSEIIEYNVMDNDSFRYTWERALSQMLEDDVQVICSSLRTINWSETLKKLTKRLYDKNVIMIDSSDNEGREIDAYPALDKHWFAIGAYDGKGRAGYSQYGENLLGLGYTDYAVKNQYGDYIPLSHTSGAVQVVSGIAAMLKQINPNLRPLEFEEFIMKNAIRLSTENWNEEEGWGLLSLPNKVQTTIDIPSDNSNEIENDNVDFKDVKPDNWFYKAVNWATKQGIMKGYKDGTFRPNQPMTRGEYAQAEYNKKHKQH